MILDTEIDIEETSKIALSLTPTAILSRMGKEDKIDGVEWF